MEMLDKTTNLKAQLQTLQIFWVLLNFVEQGCCYSSPCWVGKVYAKGHCRSPGSIDPRACTPPPPFPAFPSTLLFFLNKTAVILNISYQTKLHDKLLTNPSIFLVIPLPGRSVCACENFPELKLSEHWRRQWISMRQVGRALILPHLKRRPQAATPQVPLWAAMTLVKVRKPPPAMWLSNAWLENPLQKVSPLFPKQRRWQLFARSITRG